MNMAMLPVMEHTLVFENEFMLTDNFGLSTRMDEVSDFVAPLYPFKIDFTLMLFCTQGMMRLRINLQECRLEAGQVLVVLPGTVGECLEVSGDCQVAMIAYVGDKYGEGIDATSSMLFMKFLVRQSVLAISPEEMDESLAIYRAMRRKVEQHDFEFTREALNGYMQVLFCNGRQWMSRYTRQQEAGRVQSRQQMVFERFLWLVQKHYREERGIAFYAGKLCLTPKYLSTVCKESSGYTASELINRYVVKDIEYLLKKPGKSIKEICNELEFPNLSFFGRYVKKHLGASPKQYREKVLDDCPHAADKE